IRDRSVTGVHVCSSDLSATVSPLPASATRNPASATGDAVPLITSFIAQRACSRGRSRPARRSAMRSGRVSAASAEPVSSLEAERTCAPFLLGVGVPEEIRDGFLQADRVERFGYDRFRFWPGCEPLILLAGNDDENGREVEHFALEGAGESHPPVFA